MSNNNSIWFAVDEDGMEYAFYDIPVRQETGYWNNSNMSWDLWPGAIKAITGRVLTWQDDPIEWVPREKQNAARPYDGCLSCVNNIPGIEAGYWCATHCINGSKYEKLKP